MTQPDMTPAIKRAAGALHTHRTGRDNTICVDSDDSPASCWPLAHIALAAALDDREGMVTAAGLHDPVECSHVGDGPTQRWWLCEECSWESPRSRTRVPRDALRHQVDALVSHLLGGEGE